MRSNQFILTVFHSTAGSVQFDSVDLLLYYYTIHPAQQTVPTGAIRFQLWEIAIFLMKTMALDQLHALLRSYLKKR